MKIKLHNIKIKDIFNGYKNSDTEGVVGYGGLLNIRPKYQREFVYKDSQRDAVITTVKNNFPLNTMYWAKNTDGTYEIIDGQQRTISFCEYLNSNFSLDYRYFFNLSKEEQDIILNYELQVYICEGTDKEKLDWFKIINIAGEKLTDQELRNAVYSSPYITDAKKYFSKPNCVAYNLGKDYMNGSTIRQDYLEKVLKWKANAENTTIEEYMAEHQLNDNASELWAYFQNIINWIKVNFKKYYKEMKGIDWGILYNNYKNKILNPDEVEKRIKILMIDSDVTKKSGIFEYILSGKEKLLSIRAFDENTKREVYERQDGHCPVCGQVFDIKDMHADHVTPWSKGGRTVVDNCRMLCADCNRRKSNI